MKEPALIDGEPLILLDAFSTAKLPAIGEDPCKCCKQTYNYCQCTCQRWRGKFRTGTITLTLADAYDYTCAITPGCQTPNKLFLSALNGAYSSPVVNGSWNPINLGVLGNVNNPGRLLHEGYSTYQGTPCTLFRSYFWQLEFFSIECYTSNNTSWIGLDFICRYQTFVGNTLVANGLFPGQLGVQSVTRPWGDICQGEGSSLTLNNDLTYVPAFLNFAAGCAQTEIVKATAVLQCVECVCP